MKLSELTFYVSKDPAIYASFLYKDMREFRKSYERILQHMTAEKCIQTTADLMYSECIGAIAFIASNSTLKQEEVKSLCSIAEIAYKQYHKNNSLSDLCNLLMLVAEPLNMINDKAESCAMDTCKKLINSTIDKISNKEPKVPDSYMRAMNFFDDEYIAGKIACVNDTPNTTRTYYKHLYQSCKSHLGKKPEDIPSMFVYMITAKKKREALLYYKLSEHILGRGNVEEWYPLIDFYYSLEAETTTDFLQSKKYDDTDVNNYVKHL